MKLKTLYVILLLMLGYYSQAQNYPVQTFIQISPPFTSYLPDYSNPANEQMKIFLTLTDMTVPSYDVKLRFKFQGSGYTIENPTYLNLLPITITPGTPYELSGAALATYLSSQNLVFSGINTADYETRKVLPEGPCLICVEVYDYNSPTPSLLGNPSCSNVWFSMYDPPYLNTPICGYEAPVSDPQQILFNWTPLNMVSPTGVNATEYVFELFEVRPEGADPNIVVNSTLPIFMQITNQSFVNYSITEPQLQVGMEYVWRVQARDNSGRDYFKNQGYSQVCTFTYGSIAGSLIDGVTLTLNSDGTGVRQGTAWWNGNGAFDSYILETRKTGNSSYEWFPLGVMGLSAKINSLEPETEYECRVKGLAGGEESEWSNISVFTTQPPPNYSCGTTILPATQPNIVPYVNATEGMVFTVGQFDMMVTSITPLTDPGHYVGSGKISIPFALINLNVSFEDILVDENLAVREGKVEAISKGMDAWIGDILKDQCLQNSYNFPGVDTIIFTDSTALVQFGEQTLLIETLPAAVITPDGYTYYIYEDGTYDFEFNGTISQDNLDASDTLKIVFEKSAFQEYGFDAFANGLWVDSYETIALDDGSNYIVPYKSILSGGEDIVMAKVIAPDNFVMDSVSFRCLDGRELNFTKLNDTVYEVQLSEFTVEEEAMYAYNGGDKMGKLNVRAYDSISENVVIVPVNGASIDNQSELENILNNIYKQALVTWNMTIDSNFTNTTWDVDNNGTLENADVNLMSHYSGEMRALRDAYLDAHPDFDKSTYILFVVDGFDQSNVQGYMVRGKGVGFLSANPLGKTIAHELGHGAFGLYHTFPTPAQGTTTNLLDYTEQTKLTKYQWEKIHNWSPTLSFLDDEEASEQAIINDISLLDEYRNDDGSLSFLTLGGTMLTISGNISYLAFATPGDKWSNGAALPMGGLTEFIVDDTVYKAIRTLNTNGAAFRGYYRNATGTNFEANNSELIHAYIDSVSCKGNINYVLGGIPSISDGAVKFEIYPLEPVLFATSNCQNFGSGTNQDVLGLGEYFNDVYIISASPKIIHANITNDYTTELTFLNQYIGNNLSGENALYAFQCAELIKSNQSIVNCLVDIAKMARPLPPEMPAGSLYVSLPCPSCPNANTNYQGELSEYWSQMQEYEFESFGEVFYYTIVSYINTVNSTQTPLLQDTRNLIHWFSLGNSNYTGINAKEKLECTLMSININARIEMLKELNKDYPSFYSAKEQLIVELIKTIPNEQDEITFINFITTQTNNGKLYFWTLYEDCSLSTKDDFVRLLVDIYTNNSSLKYQGQSLTNWEEDPSIGPSVDNEFEINTRFLEVWKNWGTNVLQTNTTFEQRSFTKDSPLGNGNVKLSFNYKFTDHDDSSRDKDRTRYYDGSPFEFVRIRFQDNYQFIGLDGERIVWGKEMIVPAFWLYWMLEEQKEIDDLVILRKTMDALAVVAVIATGGEPGPLFLVDFIWAGTDMAIATVEDDLLSSGDPDVVEMLDWYNTASMFYGGAFLVRGIVNSGPKIIANIKNLPAKIKNAKNLSRSSFNNNVLTFKQFYKNMKGLGNQFWTQRSVYLAKIKTALYEMEINQYYGLSNESRIIVANGDNVVVELIDQTIGNTYPQFQIATATYDEAAEYTCITLSQTKEYQYTSIQTTDHKMFELEGVPYKTTSSDPVQFGGDIEIIRTADDHVYWRIVSSGTNATALINKLDNLGYGNISSWIQEGVSSQIMTKLDNLSNSTQNATILSSLDADLGTISQSIKQKLNNINSLDGWIAISKRSQMRVDPEILDAMTNLIANNKDFVNQNQQLFDNLFEKLAQARARCSTCPNSTGGNIDLQVGNMHDVINDLNDAITQYANPSDGYNFMGFLNEMKQTDKKAKAGAYTLDLLNNRMTELSENGVYELFQFEGNIPDVETGHLLDLKFYNPQTSEIKLIEVKNWANSNNVGYGQFRAYVTGGSKFEYYFNGNAQAMKVKFQQIFSDLGNAEELFIANESMFINNNINSFAELNNLANQSQLINHPIFSFIK